MFTNLTKNEFLTRNTEETEAIGRALAEYLRSDGRRRAFIAMRGEMGVGKTAFVRGFASTFGISSVKSPTYTMVNEYRADVRIFHFDMYRIESTDDLISIGYDDYIMTDGFSIAEWCENIEEDIPTDAINVLIEKTYGGESERKITVTL